MARFKKKRVSITLTPPLPTKPNLFVFRYLPPRQLQSFDEGGKVGLLTLLCFGVGGVNPLFKFVNAVNQFFSHSGGSSFVFFPYYCF